MKDVRFYLEFPSRAAKKRSGKSNTGHCGNVFAVFNNGLDPLTGYYEGIGAVLYAPNSPVASTATSREHLSECKRVPEALARKIHPALFVRLDDKQ